MAFVHRMNALGEISPYIVTDTFETSKLGTDIEATQSKREVHDGLCLKTVWLKDDDGLTHEVEYGVGYIFPVLAAQMRKGMGTSRDNAIALPYKVKVPMLMPTYDLTRSYHDPFVSEERRKHVVNKLICLDPVSLHQVMYACEKLEFYPMEKGPARDPQTQRLRKLLARRKEKKILNEEKIQLGSEDCPIGYLLSKFSADSGEVDRSSKIGKNKKKKQRRKDQKRNASSNCSGIAVDASSDNALEVQKKEFGGLDAIVHAAGNSSQNEMDSEFKRKLKLQERPQEEFSRK